MEDELELTDPVVLTEKSEAFLQELEDGLTDGTLDDSAVFAKAKLFLEVDTDEEAAFGLILLTGLANGARTAAEAAAFHARHAEALAVTG